MPSDVAADHRRPASVLLRGLRIAVWAVLHWALSFTEQVLEVLAPLVLVCGLAWWALPRIVGLVPLEGPARDMAGDVMAHLPGGLRLEGLWVTPAGLIGDGLLLMALAALLQTLAAVLTYEVYERR